MSNTPTPKHTPDLALRTARGWIAASIFQGERLEKLVGVQAEYGANFAEKTPAERRAVVEASSLSDGSLVEVYEGFFFVVAVHLARRWLKIAARVQASLGPAVSAFEAATPHVVDIRDMRTHEDEYLVGDGKRQGDYLFADGWLPVSAHGIRIVGDDYQIGGRVSLGKTLAALRAVQPVVETEFQRLPPPPA